MKIFIVGFICVFLMSCQKNSTNSLSNKEDRDMILVPYKGVGNLKIGEHLTIDAKIIKLMKERGVFAITDPKNNIEIVVVRNPSIRVEHLDIGVNDSLNKLKKIAPDGIKMFPSDSKNSYRRAYYNGVTYELNNCDKILTMTVHK